jgi:D-Tyr-tRNAtyr deacylase
MHTSTQQTSEGNSTRLFQSGKPRASRADRRGFCGALRDLGAPVETGVFGTRMEVSLVNDGPVTIVLDV